MTQPPNVPTEVVLVKVTVRSNPRLAPPVCALVRQTALEAGFEASAAEQLELMAEEACQVVMAHAFAGRTDAHFDLLIKCRSNQIVIILQDDGLPLDILEVESDEVTRYGMKILRSFSDELNFINLGPKGSCIEMVKNLETPGPESGFELIEDFFDAPPEKTPISDLPVTTRPMTPEDALSLARCMYYVYGRTYKEFVYFPEKIKDLILSGRLYSYVAVTPEGEIVAHQGLMRRTAVSGVAEITMGVVDPRFRGRGLFEQLKKEAFAIIADKGVYGLFGEAVTVHGYSQKTNGAMGGRETGFLFNYISSARSFKAIAEGEASRQAVVWFYTRIGEEPERIVYPPARHAEMIQRIYANANLRRVLAAEPAELILPERSEVETTPLSEASTVVLRVHLMGQDLIERLRSLRDRLRRRGFAVIYLDLPLGAPATTHYALEIEALGFFFAAVAPETLNGDALRLQHLNSPRPDPSTIVAVSDFAKELLKYTIDCMTESLGQSV